MSSSAKLLAVLLTFHQFCAKVMSLGYNPNLGNQVLWCPPFKVSSWSGNTQETREGTFKKPARAGFFIAFGLVCFAAHFAK